MKIYVAMIADRHHDTDAVLFSTPEKAIEYAKEYANSNASDPIEDIEESQIEGWLYYATYSCEGDSVWVIEKELDGGE